MCNYKTWWCDDHGAVLQCYDCNCFQLTIGTTMITLDEKNFIIFTEMINYRFSTLQPLGMDNKYIVLPSPCASINIVLNENELGILNNMLQHVDNEIRCKQLFNLFKEN